MNLPLQLDRASNSPLQDQLFEQLRKLILTGRLKPNTRVIATRFLAEQIGVSRTTVLLAYERLISEGYLDTRPAIGTYVSASLPDGAKLDRTRVNVPDRERQAALRPALMDDFCAPRDQTAAGGIDFSPGRFDSTNLMPPKNWMKAVRSVFECEPAGLAKVQPAAGVLALRRTIADYLSATRGIMVSPDQVIVVVGQRQASGFVTHLFQRPGDPVVLESPCDPEIVAYFRARHAEIIEVPVGESGLNTDKLPDRPVSLAYVTPARQCGLGGTMSTSHRETLIAWARRTGAYIIEDDDDSEFRYQGNAPQPLAALDPYGLVFHTGSFAKTLGAGLGLGYLVVPAELVDQVVAIKSMAEAHSPWLEQMVIADLLATGEYEHHLRRVRKAYLERRDCLIHSLKANFGDIQLAGVDCGTQLTWLLPEHLPSAALVHDLARSVGVTLGSLPRRGGPEHPFQHRAVVFGYAALTLNQLREGIARLARALKPAFADAPGIPT